MYLSFYKYKYREKQIFICFSLKISLVIQWDKMSALLTISLIS